MNKKNKYILTMILILVIVFIIVLAKKNKYNDIVVKEDNTTITLNPNETIFLEDITQSNFTCTGIAYDNLTNTFWIADYGAENKDKPLNPRLIQLDEKLSEIYSIIDLANFMNDDFNIQGITYDTSSDSIWIAVGKSIINIDKKGNLLNAIDLKDYAKYSSNGIAYDKNNDTIWILFYKKYLLNIDKNGEVLLKQKVNLKDQDHIFLNDEGNLMATVGADYYGENNYIVDINKATGEIGVKYKIIASYAVEGLCILNNKLYVVNDGFYHNAKINKSYIQIYNLENVY